MIGFFDAADAGIIVAAVTAAGSLAVTLVTNRRVGKPNGHGHLVTMAESSLSAHEETRDLMRSMAVDMRQLRADLMTHIHDGHPVAPGREAA